ncbi:hypothetical protein CCMA1212_010091 [Trichoderma ghanense]|uniref:Uncharacterized protein n=1 Tax=Trichoderma ghanense TaxID=65468 RepID=A0ABY2GQQ1_9HYPO
MEATRYYVGSSIYHTMMRNYKDVGSISPNKCNLGIRDESNHAKRHHRTAHRASAPTRPFIRSVKTPVALSRKAYYSSYPDVDGSELRRLARKDAE